MLEFRMQVRVLGAHNFHSKHTRSVSILIDGVLCIDAGSLSTGLTFEEQGRVKAVLLTHWHFDHIQGLPTFALATAGGVTTDVYAIAPVLEALSTHIINGVIFPTFREPLGSRYHSLELRPIEPFEETEVAGYAVVATPVQHGVPAVGYQVSGPDGKSLFYTGDTSGDLAEAWEHIAPDVLLCEVTFPDSRRKSGRHMSPADLEEELRRYVEMKGSAPRVVTVHMTPEFEGEIRDELAGVAQRLGVSIELAYEDMVIDL